MIGFRELGREHLPFLIEVRNECRAMLHDDSEFTLSQAQQWFETQRPKFYLVTHADTPIGYFRTSHWDRVNGSVYVGLDLHVDFRGKGWATAAYGEFLQHMFEVEHMNKVTVEVLEHNVWAQRLYRRLGFVIEDIKRQAVRRQSGYLDSLVMSMRREDYLAKCASTKQFSRQVR